ncbi:hypothetical protein GWK47_052369 [Chionoecetes opilio]|uniref:Secreted protein n=1 Tax=Chionoecetes opilio TaxID=41210 RepID=A0A8J5CAC4_CHIOP|nr:hypothetical protein GWK47_052369 [Chionoecetes opilio]
MVKARFIPLFFDHVLCTVLASSVYTKSFTPEFWGQTVPLSSQLSSDFGADGKVLETRDPLLKVICAGGHWSDSKRSPGSWKILACVSPRFLFFWDFFPINSPTSALWKPKPRVGILALVQWTAGFARLLEASRERQGFAA